MAKYFTLQKKALPRMPLADAKEGMKYQAKGK